MLVEGSLAGVLLAVGSAVVLDFGPFHPLRYNVLRAVVELPGAVTLGACHSFDRVAIHVDPFGRTVDVVRDSTFFLPPRWGYGTNN